MKFKQQRARRGFTLIELAVVTAIIVILASLVLPALTGTHEKSESVRCGNNLRQLQIVWEIYADDFNEVLPPNSPASAQPQARKDFGEDISWCGTGMEGWGNQDANTNSAYYANSVLAPYIGSQTRVYKCPGDILPSANGQRLRSYSMNCQMGQALSSQKGPAFVVNENPGYQVFNSMKDFSCFSPSQAWIFCDEHAGSIDDGFFRLKMTSGVWPDVPASYHNGACSFSFADCHVETRKWLTAQIKVPVVAGIPAHDAQGATTNADYVWFTQHSTCAVGPY